MQRRESLKKQTREMPAALKRTLLASESGLEIIKETDDYNTTPMKVKEPRIKIPIDQSSEEEEKHGASPIQEEVKKETPVKKAISYKSGIIRRNTMALKPPTKLAEEVESKKIPKALARLRKEPDTSPGTTYVTSGVNTTKKSFTNQLIKTESHLKKSVSSIKPPTSSLKSPTSSLKPPSSSLKPPSSTQKQSPSSLKPVTQTPSPHKSFKRPSPNSTSKTTQEALERKRKMMAERKLLLKKKLAAVKIQKFWAARKSRRALRQEFLKLSFAVRRIQKWYRRVKYEKMSKRKLLEEMEGKWLEEVERIQRAYRRYRQRMRRLDVGKFKQVLLGVIIGWRVRRVFQVLRSDHEVREAMDVIKMHEDAKDQDDNLFFKQIKEKFPQMMQLFHKKLDELMESKSWPEKPVVVKKVLANKNVLKSKRFDMPKYKPKRKHNESIDKEKSLSELYEEKKKGGLKKPSDTRRTMPVRKHHY